MFPSEEAMIEEIESGCGEVLSDNIRRLISLSYADLLNKGESVSEDDLQHFVFRWLKVLAMRLLPCERFFLDKIQFGLGHQLPRDQDDFLSLSPAQSVVFGELNDEEELKKLFACWIDALARAYDKDLEIWKTIRDSVRRQSSSTMEWLHQDPVYVWRQQCKELVRSSKKNICLVTKAWYLKVGRSQEKKTGCLGSVAIFLILLFALLAAILVLVQ